MAEIVVYGLYDKSRTVYAGEQVVGVIHFAVAVGQSSEVETDLCEAEGGSLKALTIPQGFHDIKAGVG